MLKITATVTYEDGKTVKVIPKPVDFVKFERHFEVGMGTLATEQRLEHIYWLAWTASARTGDGRDFDTWLDSVVDIDVEVDVQSVPLDATPSTTS